jgi:hypothetical protein
MVIADVRSSLGDLDVVILLMVNGCRDADLFEHRRATNRE